MALFRACVPVHLSQQLVDGLSGVGVHGRLDPLPPHTVQLVNEDDTRSVSLRLPWGKDQKVINKLLTIY